MQGNVIQALGDEYSRSSLKDSVFIRVEGNSQLLTIFGEAESPRKATRLVKTYATTFQDEVKELLNLDNITILDEISPATDVTEKKPSPYLFAGIVFMGSLLIVFFVLLIQEFYFSKLTSPEKTENFLKIPNLGIIPARQKHDSMFKKKLFRKAKMTWNERLMPMSTEEKEEFRRIRANLIYQMERESTRAIMLTSPIFSEGVSVVSKNLATVMAMDGKETVYVDANLRTPMGRKVFDLPNRIGITSYVASNFEVDEVIQSTGIENLSFISSGPMPPNPTEILSCSKMRQLITVLKEQFDVVIIDAPPLEVADAISLSTIVDSCLYVINTDHTKGELAAENLEYLRKVNAPITGTIMSH